MTEVFVEQPLASPASAKNWDYYIYVNYSFSLIDCIKMRGGGGGYIFYILQFLGIFTNM